MKNRTVQSAHLPDTPYICHAERCTPNGDKLICLAHAGGGASTFLNWQAQLGSKAEVLPIQLPGHENRIEEPLFWDAEEAAAAVAEAIAPYIRDCKAAVYGHSAGGILAFALTGALERMGIKPCLCVISSTYVYEEPDFVLSSSLSDAEFLERVYSYGALSPDSKILEYPEFQEIFLKILRADFNLGETVKAANGKIHAPILAMCGDSETTDNLALLHRWEKYTTETVSYREYAGDHFYISAHLPEICAEIAAAF